MRNFQRLRQDHDLADEFLKLCLIKARCNGSSVRMLQMAREMVAEGRCSKLVEVASTITWGDAARAWIRMTGPERVMFDDAVRKATVPIGTTLTSSPANAFAESLVGVTTLMQAYFRSLVNKSLLDAIVSECIPVPPNTKVTLTTGVGTGNSALEATWMPLMSLEFDVQQTAPSKALGLFVVSEDILRMGGELADNFLKAEMSRAIVVAQDIVALDVLTAGLSPTSSTGGPRGDLRKALEGIDLSQWSKPMIFTSSVMLEQLATMGESGNASTPSHNAAPTFPDVQLPNGGTIAGMPIMAVDALNTYAGFSSPHGDYMVVVDAAQIAGSAGTMDLLASNDASLLMEDSGTSPHVPVPGSPWDEPTAAQMVSMFQANAVAFRGTRYFSLFRARDAAVSVVGPCSYGL